MAYEIIEKRDLTKQIFLMTVKAPAVAHRAEPGQFIILRTDERGERVPFTIADFDREKGTVTIIVQAVGKTTRDMQSLKSGDTVLDFAGPLGTPTPLENLKNVLVIGGGLGTAITYPQAKKLKALGARVTMIAGFKNKESIILEKELSDVSDKLIITTDDGSNGLKGFVTDRLKEELQSGESFDEVITVGPLMMMKGVCEITKEQGIHTTVSMNPVMIDGTGMCGGCRVIVDGKPKFACVDGPDFDGHKIDWDIAIKRQGALRPQEKAACEQGECRIGRSNGHG
ncbi:MAG: sulfide/dihydroorotate dehydrogenase-like FAD/NAD-binding protein [Acutalibacteraceae bacterium]